MRTRVCVHGCYGEGELPRKVISGEEKGGREGARRGERDKRERERKNKKGRGKGGDEASVVKSTIAASVKNSN